MKHPIGSPVAGEPRVDAEEVIAVPAKMRAEDRMEERGSHFNLGIAKGIEGSDGTSAPPCPSPGLPGGPSYI